MIRVNSLPASVGLTAAERGHSRRCGSRTVRSFATLSVFGVAPFLSMARSLNRDELESVDLYYCVETAAEALFLDELRATATGRASFRVALVPRDEVGFITASAIGTQIEDLSSCDMYVCGPPAMITSPRAQLIDEGVPAERIHSEEFSFVRVPGRLLRMST